MPSNKTIPIVKYFGLQRLVDLLATLVCCAVVGLCIMLFIVKLAEVATSDHAADLYLCVSPYPPSSATAGPETPSMVDQR